ncbi:MAG: hypothetical protein ACUVUP_02520 [Thermaceae bacterium]
MPWRYVLALALLLGALLWAEARPFLLLLAAGILFVRSSCPLRR